jgi:hypothetical protein
VEIDVNISNTCVDHEPVLHGDSEQDLQENHLLLEEAFDPRAGVAVSPNEKKRQGRGNGASVEGGKLKLNVRFGLNLGVCIYTRER